VTDLTDVKVDITIIVNTVEVREHVAERTGLQIKEDAIDAGAKIKRGYVLDEERGHEIKRIADDDVVHLHTGLVFTAHPGGHDS
jgi:hypothetical protein